jgi:hypothetical protein
MLGFRAAYARRGIKLELGERLPRRAGLAEIGVALPLSRGD